MSDHEYSDGTGVGLINVILKKTSSRQISITKLVGFGSSDGASMMSGGGKGVKGVLM